MSVPGFSRLPIFSYFVWISFYSQLTQIRSLLPCTCFIYSNVDSTLFVVHCDLYCENKKESRSLVCLPSTVPPEPSGMEQGIFSIKEPKYVRNLTGTLTANANHLLDDKKLPGIFFIFHDLSVRTDGWFTLKFMFMDLDAG